MNRHFKTLLILSLATLLRMDAGAQLTVRRTDGINRVFSGGFDDEPRVVTRTPPLLVAGPKLEMRETAIGFDPTGFTLQTENGQVFGPFRLETGAVVGSALNSYTLRRVGDPAEAAFTLVSPGGGVHGPFTARAGERIVLGQTPLTLARLPATLGVVASHNRAAGTPAVIALGPLNASCRRALFALRDALIARANLLAEETAPKTIVGLPTVVTRHGVRHEPTFQRSLRDRQSALDAADRSAAVWVDGFIRRHLPHRAPPEEDGVRRFRSLAPGPWLLCGMILVKTPAAQPVAPSVTAYWWAPFELDADTTATLTLNEENACAWPEIFLFPQEALAWP